MTSTWGIEDSWRSIQQLDAFDARDPRFARFLEGLVSSEYIPDEPAQRHIVDTVNPVGCPCR